MSITLLPGALAGTVTAPASKSMAHRLLICAALGEEPVSLELDSFSDDIAATARCLSALGAGIDEREYGLEITPIAHSPSGLCSLDCGESGSTLRFLLPLLGALGVNAEIHMRGRLPLRPLSPLDEVLKAHGMELSRQGDRLLCSGQLCAGDYSLPGDVSSQYISGLLMALPRLDGDSRLTVTGRIESADYIRMTMDVLVRARAGITEHENLYDIHGGTKLCLPRRCKVEGDYSGAAFMLCAGAMSDGGVTVCGLDTPSAQGDSAVLELLGRFGAQLDSSPEGITVRKASLRAIDIDASQIPDLVPILSVLAAAAEGETRITGAARLRLKESDRIESTAAMLKALGGRAEALEDGLIIQGGTLRGGSVRAENDHRIAMAAGIAACVCEGAVSIDDPGCVAKSYPAFWTARESLGGRTI